MLNVRVKCTHVPKVVKHGPIVGSPRTTVYVRRPFIEVPPDFLQLSCVLAHFMTSLLNAFIILQHSTATRDAVRPTLPDGQPKNLLEKQKKIGTLFYID